MRVGALVRVAEEVDEARPADGGKDAAQSPEGGGAYVPCGLAMRRESSPAGELLC